eukprot:2938549-Pleurochrysis_carterae.AAC.2
MCESLEGSRSRLAIRAHLPVNTKLCTRLNTVCTGHEKTCTDKAGLGRGKTRTRCARARVGGVLTRRAREAARSRQQWHTWQLARSGAGPTACGEQCEIHVRAGGRG